MFNFLFGFSSSAHMGRQPWFTADPEYKVWIKDKPPEFNIWEYLDFKKALNHSNRLEF
jgi:hypothetical protein